MNDELQKALAAILTKTTQAAEAGVSFLSQQLPEVIQQLLIWKAVESGLCFVALLAIVIFAIVVCSRTWKKIKNFKPKNSYDDCYGLYMVVIVSGMMGFGVGLVSLKSLDWLQILIAPKVYLIEYAASLAK